MPSRKTNYSLLIAQIVGPALGGQRVSRWGIGALTAEALDKGLAGAARNVNKLKIAYE